jgi:serine/threonine-protein kinase
VQKTPKITSSVPEGQVVAQSINPNDPVEPGTTVILTVAQKPAAVSVPSLRCFTISQAQDALAAAQLTLGAKATAATADTACQPGQIIDQSPAVGDTVQPGTLVDVTLNPATPTTVTLDDYTCVTYGKAKSELRKLGLVPAFRGTTTPLPQCPNPNFVAMQDPAAGTVVPLGSTVGLFTGSEASPSPTGSPSP